jgi:hypothetical protein
MLSDLQSNLILDKGNLSEQITQHIDTYFIYIINNVMQHRMPLCEKVIAPLHSITGFVFVLVVAASCYGYACHRHGLGIFLG